MARHADGSSYNPLIPREMPSVEVKDEQIAVH